MFQSQYAHFLYIPESHVLILSKYQISSQGDGSFSIGDQEGIIARLTFSPQVTKLPPLAIDQQVPQGFDGRGETRYLIFKPEFENSISTMRSSKGDSKHVIAHVKRSSRNSVVLCKSKRLSTN